MKGARGKRQPDYWLTWPAGVAGKTGWAAECLLRQYGIAALNRRYAYQPGDSYGVLIRGSQAKWAEYLLMAGGYPLNSRLLNPKHANIKREAMPPAWGKPARPSGLRGWYHRLFGLATVGDTAVELKTRSTKGRKP